MKNKTILITVFLFWIMLPFSSAIPFSSTYLQTINGKPTMQVNAGNESSYFIYLQNEGNKSAIVKINVTGEPIINSLENQYIIPANTNSDAFPVELKIKVREGIPPGTDYKITYSIFEGSNSSTGMVTFSPISYNKIFYVRVDNSTPSNNGGGTGNNGVGGGGSGGGIPQIKKINASSEKKENISVEKINKTQEKNKEILFDILVKVLKKEISQKENLSCSISLVNLGVPKKVNVSVDYIIKDSVGNIYSEKSETVPVETQLDFIKEFDISELKEGEYIIVADLTYEGQTEPASSEDIFTIVKKSNNKIILLIVLGILAIIVSLGLFFFILYKRRKKEKVDEETKKNKWKNMKEPGLVENIP